MFLSPSKLHWQVTFSYATFIFCNILKLFSIIYVFLLLLYRQKLSELDEITQRLKKKLHVVMNEGLTAPFVCLIHETENSRSEAASHIVSNTKDGKCTETAAISSVNEDAYEGKLVLKVTNLSQVAVGCSKFSLNTLRTGLLNCLNARSRGLTFRHRASSIWGQAFRYSPVNAFYIFNQQIYFII